MKPASLHRRILFPLLLCGGLLFALLFWYFSPFFSPGENRRFSAYVEERFHSEVTSSAITLHYTSPIRLPAELPPAPPRSARFPSLPHLV